MSGSIEVVVSVHAPSDLNELATDETFEENLEKAISKTLNVDPQTVSISSIKVVEIEVDGTLEVNYSVAF